MSRPLSLGLYRAFMGALEPAAPMLLRRRAAAGKEMPARLDERLGRASRDRPDGPLVWMHGVSVGESLSLLPLIDRVRAEHPKVTILVTTGTVTSANLLARRLPAGVIHQFAPVDGPRAVARFLNHWRPDLGLIAESELWPNLILGAADRGVRLALVSARFTARAAKGWARRKRAAASMLRAFDVVLPQDEASAQRLAALGAQIGPLLNLKFVGGPLPCDEGQLKRQTTATAGRKVIVAASTHPGEDEAIARAAPAGALTIIVPRHPERGPGIETALSTSGRLVARRSAGANIDPGLNIYVADTLGEMGLFLRLADVVVMGGSFVPGIGGHNPLEPARLQRAIVSGPDVFNFGEVYAGMSEAGAAVLTPMSDLAATLEALIAHPKTAKAMAKQAAAYAARQAADFEAGWSTLRELMP